MAFRTELAAVVAEIMAAARDRLASEDRETDVSALLARWSDYGEGDPSLLGELIDTAPEPVREHIEVARSDVARVSAVVERWHGDAAVAFRRSFLGSYDAAVAGQLDVVAELGGILAAYRAVMVAARRTLLDIGRATLIALAGAPAETVPDVLASMDEAVTRLGEHVDAEETLILTAIGTARAALDTGLHRLVPADSGIGDALDAFAGTSDPHTVTAIAELYRAGSVDLTDAAGHYEQAWRGLDLSVVAEPAAFGSWFARSLPDYRALRETFSSRVLLATRDELMRHGDDLCGAALLCAEATGVDAREILRVPDAVPEPSSTDVTVLAGLGDPRSFDPAAAWVARPARARLRVAIGLGDDGAPVELDLKDPAQGGTGPHGLVDGAAAPQLLRALVVALAAGHDPATLNFLLIGTAFAELDRLPHTSAVITDGPAVTGRLREAITGELIRRQELLRRSGTFDSVRDYERVRAAGAPLNPLPSLLIVCDTWPGLADVFARIGAAGGALGVHLLLVGRDDAPYLSYRIELPAPGRGRLRAGNGPPVPFATAHVSADSVLVERMRGRGAPAHRVWLPPLRESPGLDDLLPHLVREPGYGITVGNAEARGRLMAPVGIVDRPREQRRDLLLLDLAGAAGNVLIVGGSTSGRSTLLRTLILSLALTHTAREVQFYCLDPGGGSLALLRDLPHVGAVAAARDPDRVRRTVGSVAEVIRRREAAGVAPMAAYRRSLAEGRVAADPYGDVFLVVDGWTAFDVPEEIATRGLPVGVHVVATAERWTDVPYAAFGTRLELRLADPAGSMVDPRAAAEVPENAPGRGLTPDAAHFLAALPRVEGDGDGTASLVRVVADVRTAWDGPLAPPVL